MHYRIETEVDWTAPLYQRWTAVVIECGEAVYSAHGQTEDLAETRARSWCIAERVRRARAPGEMATVAEAAR